jgi:hypothetical protein
VNWDELRHRKVELLLIAAGVSVALATGVFQYLGLVNTLDSSTAASVYSQQQEIDQMFVENIDLQPYFWLGQRLPEPDLIADPSEKNKAMDVIAKSEAASYRVLDHFAHLLYQMDKRAFAAERTSWEAYIKGSFERSPVLCRSLWEDRAAFGGDVPDSLWGLYARRACPDIGSL